MILKWIRSKFLLLYFYISLLIGFGGFLVICGLANDLNDTTARNQSLLQENRVLKKKVWCQQSQKTSVETIDNSSKNILTTAPKPQNKSLILPTVTATRNMDDLIPFSENKNGKEKDTNSTNNIKIQVYGSSKDNLLGELYLHNYLQPAMDGVKILGIECYGTCLPGDSREHRGGVHQGLDHYTKDCGTLCVYGTPIKAIYDGKIIRIDSDYKELSYSEIDNIYYKLSKIGKSGVDINYNEEYQCLLDKVRGRQVIIDHDNGLVSAYCHLSDVKSDLLVGDVVRAGDEIGKLGNSGTLKGADDNENGHIQYIELIGDPSSNYLKFIAREWHLHLELWFSRKGADDPDLKIQWLNWKTWKEAYGCE